jgi:hypothetical protein
MILLESDDATAALLECEGMERRHGNLVANVNCWPWRDFLSTWQNKMIQGTNRKFDEDQDADCVKMTIVVI